MSSAINLLAVKADRPSGATNWVHKRFANSARALHRSVEELLKAVHMCLQAVESRPDGPADPLHQRAARWIMGPVISSKMTGCVMGAGSFGITVASRWIG